MLAAALGASILPQSWCLELCRVVALRQMVDITGHDIATGQKDECNPAKFTIPQYHLSCPVLFIDDFFIEKIQLMSEKALMVYECKNADDDQWCNTRH